MVVLLLAALQQPLPHSGFSAEGHRQFDFWVGEWDVNLRMIQDDGGFEDRVAAVARVYAILKGRAVLELWDSPPIKGYSLRYYDPAADEWVLWLNWPGENRSRSSSLSGGFRHGRGDFFAERTSTDGDTTRFRYSFNDITSVSLRWDDHTSTDGGKTWRPNWIMEFTRKRSEPTFPIPRDDVPTFETGGRCTLEGFRSYEGLEGDWEGSFGGEATTLRAYRVLDGCAVLLFIGSERFGFLTFDTAREQVSLDWLGDDPAKGIERFWGSSLASLESLDGGLSWSLSDDRLELRLRLERADGTEELGRFQR